MDNQATDERSNQDIFNEVGRQGGLLFEIMRESQREQRSGLAHLESRTTAVEVDVARLSSAITNLVESLSALTKTFEKQSTARDDVLARLKRIEDRPSLNADEISRLQRANKDQDDHQANRDKASFDLRIGLIMTGFGAICAIITTLVTLYFTGAIHIHL